MKHYALTWCVGVCGFYSTKTTLSRGVGVGFHSTKTTLSRGVWVWGFIPLKLRSHVVWVCGFYFSKTTLSCTLRWCGCVGFIPLKLRSHVVWVWVLFHRRSVKSASCFANVRVFEQRRAIKFYAFSPPYKKQRRQI